MSRDQIDQYNKLRKLLWFAYSIPDRDLRVRAVGNIQTRLASMVTE